MAHKVRNYLIDTEETQATPFVFPLLSLDYKSCYCRLHRAYPVLSNHLRHPLVSMSSLAYSAGTCNQRKISSLGASFDSLFHSRTSTSQVTRKSPTVEFHECSVDKMFTFIAPLVLQHKNEQSPAHSLFSRRQAIGFAFSYGFLHVFPQPQLVAAAAVAIPCELREAPSGLAYCDRVVGSGAEALKGKLIKAHYVGRLENGTVFDSSYKRGKPLAFRVGVGEVIEGWDEGIVGGDGVPPMLAGGKRTLKIPPQLGYGTRGAGCRGGSCIIPPNSVLIFDVEFIG